MIELKNLNIEYDKKSILKDINFSFKSGILNILGENGCGKSSLLKAILNLISFRGEIIINSKNIKEISVKDLAKMIAYIPQSNQTPFNYKAIDIVLMGRLAHKNLFENYSKEDERISLECMEILGILDLANKDFFILSGGQKQLVLIARALASKAKTIIMDEPVNGLDFGNQIRLLEMVKKLARDEYNFIITTHQPRHAKFIGGESLLIKNSKILAKIKSQDLNNDLISALYEVDYKKYKDIL